MEHPAFKNMIDIAARATNGVTIPNYKQTQQAIIDLFKKNLTNLWKCLNVCHTPCLVVSSSLHWFQSKAASGHVNLTCDTWQASNADGYFTMTASAKLENPVGSVTSVKNFQRSAEVTEVAEVVQKCTVVGFLIQQVFISQRLVWWDSMTSLPTK